MFQRGVMKILVGAVLQKRYLPLSGKIYTKLAQERGAVQDF